MLELEHNGILSLDLHGYIITVYVASQPLDFLNKEMIIGIVFTSETVDALHYTVPDPNLEVKGGDKKAGENAAGMVMHERLPQVIVFLLWLLVHGVLTSFISAKQQNMQASILVPWLPVTHHNGR